MPMRETKFDLPVEIGPKIVSRKTAERAALLEDLATVEEEWRGVAGEARELGKACRRLREQVHDLSVEIRDGERIEPVLCQLVPVYDRAQIVVVRLDSDEIADVLDMDEATAAQAEILDDDDKARIDEIVKRLDAKERKP